MKYIFYITFILFSVAGYLQSQEEPHIIELKGHTDIIWSAAFSPDGKKIVTASSDGTARIWDAETGKELKKQRQDGFYAAIFSPDGKKIATLSRIGTRRLGIVTIWDVNLEKELKQLNNGDLGGGAISFSPDSRKIIVGSIDKIIRIWDVDTGKELYNLQWLLGAPASVSFTLDGKKIIAAGGQRVVIWDADTKKELQKLELNMEMGTLYSAILSPDEKKIVTVSGNRDARIWDADLGKELQILWGRGVVAVSFSPDGKRIVTASLDKTVRIWDFDSGKELKKMDRTMPWMSSVDFSPDGKKIVIAGMTGEDDTAVIWILE